MIFPLPNPRAGKTIDEPCQFCGGDDHVRSGGVRDGECDRCWSAIEWCHVNGQDWPPPLEWLLEAA